VYVDQDAYFVLSTVQMMAWQLSYCSV